jgi:hypothetical protein
MVSAVYPNGIVPWSPRVDKQNTVYAADPNTLAAEIQAIEGAIGTNPQIEYAPPIGTQISYASMSARLHDVQMGNQIPACSVANNSFTVKNNGSTHVNSYVADYDPFSMFNGTDITIKAIGWYYITANQMFDHASSGWVEIQLSINNLVRTEDWWSWDFPENKSGGSWNSSSKTLSLSWQGICNPNDRLSILSTNASNESNATVRYPFLRVSYHRSVPTGSRG